MPEVESLLVGVQYVDLFSLGDGAVSMVGWVLLIPEKLMAIHHYSSIACLRDSYAVQR